MEIENGRLRAKKKLIRVTFPDGKVICCNNASATMIAVLRTIGSDKFHLIKLDLCHLPILAREIYPKYKAWMKSVCDGWYLNTQSSTDNKYMQLRVISDQLSLNLSIETGTDFEVQVDADKEKRSRTKDRIRVRLPDGIYVANGSALDVYLGTIRRLGVDNVMRLHLTWSGHELIATSRKVHSQLQIVENRWIMVPNTTKDKAKLLRVIGLMLRIRLEVTIV